MKKLFKRITASFMCLSFLSLQTSIASQMTGSVLDNNYGGANITGSQGGFTGFDKPTDNSANLSIVRSL